MRSSCRRALTFLDVVASLTVTTVLLAALVPVLKKTADQTREQRENAAAKSLTRALASYAADNTDQLVHASPNWAWVHGGPGVTNVMFPQDPYDNARRMEGSTAKTYVAHLAGGGRIPLAEIQVDPATAANFNARPRNPSSSNSQGVGEYAPVSAQAAVVWHPTFGYNGVFVGGSFRHGGLTDPNSSGNGNAGVFYLRRMSQAVNPAKLIAFATARGGDVSTGFFWNYGASYPNSGAIRPGHWLVTPPRAGGLASSNVANWNATIDTFDPARPPSTWGNLDCRSGNSKAMVAQLDGSNQTLSIQALRDMRRWANQATGPNWSWLPGQNAVP